MFSRASHLLHDKIPPIAATLDYPRGDTLIQNASDILFFLSELSHLSPPKDIECFRKKIIQYLNEFEHKAKQSNHSYFLVDAHYILCAAIDEAILHAPWDAASLNYWRSQVIGSAFGYDRLGGEKFFIILNAAQHDPLANIELLELMFVCLSLGFKGKYELQEKGTEDLEEIRQNLFKIISHYRHNSEQIASFIGWSPLTHKVGKSRLAFFVTILAIVTLVTCFGLLKTQLYHVAQPIVKQLNGIAIPLVIPSINYKLKEEN